MQTRHVVWSMVLYVLIVTGLFIGQPSVLAASGGPPPEEPVAEFTAPEGGQYLCDSTEVIGSASCKRFSHWTLSYRTSGDVGWNELTQSSSPAKDELLWNWDTTALPEGFYDLRLAVYSNRKLEAEDTVTVNMTYLSCGDCDADFSVDCEEDVECLRGWILEGGPPPCQLRAMDVDLSTQIDILDLDYLLDYCLRGGPAPCAWTIGDVDHDFWVSRPEDCPADVLYFTAWLWEGGPAPRPLASGDVDCSGGVPDPLDLDYLSDYCYRDGPEPGVECFVCCDFDHVGGVNEDDVTYLENWLWEGGPPPMPLVSADCDGSGQVDVLDLLCLIQYVTAGGPAPACP